MELRFTNHAVKEALQKVKTNSAKIVVNGKVLKDPKTIINDADYKQAIDFCRKTYNKKMLKKFYCIFCEEVLGKSIKNIEKNAEYHFLNVGPQSWYYLEGGKLPESILKMLETKWEELDAKGEKVETQKDESPKEKEAFSESSYVAPKTPEEKINELFNILFLDTVNNYSTYFDKNKYELKFHSIISSLSRKEKDAIKKNFRKKYKEAEDNVSNTNQILLKKMALKYFRFWQTLYEMLDKDGYVPVPEVYVPKPRIMEDVQDNLDEEDYFESSDNGIDRFKSDLSNFPYCLKDDRKLFKGIEPSKLIDACFAVLFDYETRMLKVIYSKNLDGFAIKGKTIYFVDEEKSYQIKVRKPLFLKRMKYTKEGVEKFVSDLTTVKQQIRTRSSETTLILMSEV